MASFEPAASWQAVGLENLEIEMHVGAYDEERGRAQKVRVTLMMYRAHAAHRGDLADCLDYARVYRHLTTAWPTRPHTDLLEELAEDLLAFCFQDRRVEACRVRLSKPEAFGGRADPVVEVYRLRPA